MPDSCCAIGCTSRRGDKPGLCLYRIPSEEENPERRNLWICAIKRASVPGEGKQWQPSKYTRICSEHFIKGAKSDPLTGFHQSSHTHQPQRRGRGRRTLRGMSSTRGLKRSKMHWMI